MRRIKSPFHIFHRLHFLPAPGKLLPKRRRLITALIVIFPVVVTISMGLFAIHRLWIRATTHPERILSQELTNLLGLPVRIGQVEIKRNRIHFNNLVVQLPGPNSAQLLKVRSLTASYDVNRLVFPKQPHEPFFNKIAVEDPQIWISRNSKGQWNVSKLFQRKGPPPTRPLMRQLVIQNGEIHYYDALFPSSSKRLKPMRADIARIDGNVSAGQPGDYRWAVSAKGPKGWLAGTQCIGSYRSEHQVYVQLSGNQADLGRLANRFMPPTWGIANGTADMNGWVLYSLTNPSSNRLQYAATIKVKGASILPKGTHIPIKGLNAVVQLSNGSINVQAAAPWNQGAVVSSARLNWGGRQSPQISAVATAANIPLSPLLKETVPSRQLRELGKITGSADLTVEINGQLNHPAIVGVVNLHQIKYKDYHFNNSRITLSYASHQVTLALDVNAGNGELIGHAGLTIRHNPIYHVSLQGRNLNLTRLKPLLAKTNLLSIPKNEQSVGGNADFDLAFDGTRSKLRGGATFRLSQFQAGKLKIGSIRGRVNYNKGLFIIQPIAIADRKGYAVIKGDVNPHSGQLKLQIEANQLDIARLADLAGNNAQISALRGYGFLRNGRLTGTIHNPEFTGTVVGYGIDIGKVELDEISGHLIANRNQMIIGDGVIRRLPGDLKFVGTIENPFSTNPIFDLHGNYSKVSLSDLLSQLSPQSKPVDAYCSISGNANLTGSLAAPVLSLPNIELSNCYIGRYVVDSGSGSLLFNHGDVDIPKLVLQSGKTILAASGQLRPTTASTVSNTPQTTGSPTYRFVLNAQASDIPLSDLNPMLGSAANLSGYGNVSGEIGGTLGQDAEGTYAAQGLSGRLVMAVPDVRLNDVDVGSADAKMNMDSGIVTVSSASLGKSGAFAQVKNLQWQYEKSGGGGISGDIQVGPLPVAMIQQIVQNSPYSAQPANSQSSRSIVALTSPLSGALQADIKLFGTSKKPIMEAHIRGLGMTLGGTPFDHFGGDLNYQPGILSIKNLLAESGGTEIDAHGQLEIGHLLDGEVDINNAPIHMLADWIPSLQQVGGSIGSASIVFHGKPASPNVDASLELSNLDWFRPANQPSAPPSRYALSRVIVSHAKIREGVISANDVLIAKDEPPQTAKTPTGQPNLPIHYEASASGQVQFSWKPPFFPKHPQMAFTVNISDQNLGIVNVFWPGVLLKPQGHIDGNIHWVGSLRHHEVNGNLLIQASKLQFPGQATGLRDVDAQLELKGDQLVVQECSALSQLYDPRTGNALPGQNGDPIIISGSLPIFNPSKSEPGLTIVTHDTLLSANPLPVISSGAVHGVLASNLRITGSLLKPLIQGTGQLRDAVINLPTEYGKLGPPSNITAFKPRFKLAFEAGQNVHLINRSILGTNQLDIYVETAKQKAIQLNGNLSHLRLSGDLAIYRGYFSFPSARFRILPPGSISLQYPAFISGSPQPSLRVAIALKAQTFINAISMYGVRRNYTVTIEARGPITGAAASSNGSGEHLALHIVTDPPDMAGSQAQLERELAGLLGGEQSVASLSSGNTSIGQLLSNQLVGIFSSNYLPSLLGGGSFARSLGFEELTLEYNFQNTLSVLAYKHLFGPFYGSYWHSLSGPNNWWELQLSYQINSGLQLAWTTDYVHTNRLLVEGILRF